MVVAFIISVIKGALVFAVIGIILYGLYYALHSTGILKKFKRKPQVEDKIYEEVAGWIGDGLKWVEIAEKFSGYSGAEQEKYISAYLELKNIEREVKNGYDKREVEGNDSKEENRTAEAI